MSKLFSTEKTALHPRNKHRSPYDFKQLCLAVPELSRFVTVNKYNNESIDFSNAEAVKILNKALLTCFYGTTDWDIPAQYLCPPIPGRADYMHYAADLLSASNHGMLPLGDRVRVLDIGVGANCVYPIIGNHEYGWQFVGSDIDAVAINAAKRIVTKNTSLLNAVELRFQATSSDIFKGIIKPTDFFELTICNPPFHGSQAEAEAGTERKWKNLGIKKEARSKLNFGGQNAELWCEGGEYTFVQRMIAQSVLFPTNCFWYSTLISKKTNLSGIYATLKKLPVVEVKTLEMAQGQKVSRVVAWTFLKDTEQKDWQLKRWKI